MIKWGIELGGTAIGIYPVQAGNKIAVNVNVKQQFNVTTKLDDI